MSVEVEKYLSVDYFRQHDFDVTSNKIRDYINDKPRYGIKVLVDTFDFGELKINNESKEYIFSFLNSGFDDITTFTVKILGDFNLKSELPVILKPNEFCHLKVSCTPTQVGKIIGCIYINAFMAEGSHLIELTGTAI